MKTFRALMTPQDATIKPFFLRVERPSLEKAAMATARQAIKYGDSFSDLIELTKRRVTVSFTTTYELEVPVNISNEELRDFASNPEVIALQEHIRERALAELKENDFLEIESAQDVDNEGVKECPPGHSIFYQLGWEAYRKRENKHFNRFTDPYAKDTWLKGYDAAKDSKG